jgi:CHAT domain-containing protein
MKFKLLFLLLLTLIGAQFVHANWEDALKEDSGSRNAEKKKKVSARDTSETDNSEIVSKTKGPAAFETDEMKELMRKLSVIESVMPDSDPRKVLTLSQVSEGLASLGAMKMAEDMSLRAAKLADKMSGPDSEASLNCKNGLSKIYRANGDDEKAIQLLCECVDSCKKLITKAEKSGDKDDLEWFSGILIGLYSQLADAHVNNGQFAKANVFSEKALQLARQLPGPKQDFLIQQPLAARAHYFMQLGNYTDALTVLSEQKLIQEKLKTALKNKDSDPQKKAHLQRVNAAIFENLLDLHKTYVLKGEIKEAQALEPELDDISSKTSLNYIDVGSSSYFLDKAIRENMSGQTTEAARDSGYYLKYTDDFLDSALGMVESQRLGWQKSNLDISIPVAFCPTDQLAEYIVKWKGIVLDSLINDRKNLSSHSPVNVKSDYSKITALKQQLVQLQINSSGTNQSANIKKVQDLILNLQRKLASESQESGAASMASPSLAKVRESLGDDAVVVEYVTYRSLPNRRFGEEQLGAMLITKDAPPVWLPLGKLDNIRKSYNQFKTFLTATSAQSDEFKTSLSDLYQRTWSKISESLPPNVAKVYISPDSFLNFLPFSSLINPDGAFLAEKYSISYVGSSRDLLSKVSTDKNKEIKLFANPIFESTNNLISADKSRQTTAANSEYSKVSLPPLPGTQAEAENLSNLAKTSGWNTTLITGAEATKKALCDINSPAILHLATHGFYLGGETSLQDAQAPRGMTVKGTSESQTNVVNFSVLSPMVQSGIALTGAQTTLNLWKQGKAPDPANDGILTAEDVGGLNLNGTWLVTLSACETGVGEARSGEGVFGLRRAFMMAGAQNLLMTLWPVSDETTPLIMADFYKEALTTHDAPGALAKVQRDWLVKLRNEKGIVEAVRDAGPFAMVVMANPNLRKTSPVTQPSSSPSGGTPLAPTPPTASPSPSPTPVQATNERQQLKKAA